MVVDSILKEARELFKEKESETTWFKIFGIFDRLLKVVKTKEDVAHSIPVVSDLLMRSLQSDRSRLNGVALEFLKSCAETAQKGFNFNSFIPVLVRLTGKSSRVFVSRAMDTLSIVCKYADLKCILRSVNDFIENPNKNVRFAVFKIIEVRQDDAREIFAGMVEKGLKDPAQEVRSICKSIAVAHAEQPIVEREVKKNALVSVTPRKNLKVDTAYAEIKKLEDAVMKITRDQVVRKPISSDFFEKLNQLKKERKFALEKKDDDLTPRKLDKYLNKYRSTSPVGAYDSLSKAVSAKQNSRHMSTIVGPMQNDKATNMSVDAASMPKTDSPCHVTINMPEANAQNPALPEDASPQVSFIYETHLFKREMNSSACNDNSIVHKVLQGEVRPEVPASDQSIDTIEPEEIIEAYNSSIMLEKEADDASSTGDVCISELSQSFVNMSIEPSFQLHETPPEVVRSSSVIIGYETPLLMQREGCVAYQQSGVYLGGVSSGEQHSAKHQDGCMDSTEAYTDAEGSAIANHGTNSARDDSIPPTERNIQNEKSTKKDMCGKIEDSLVVIEEYEVNIGANLSSQLPQSTNENVFPGIPAAPQPRAGIENENGCTDQDAIISMYEDEIHNACDITQESMENKRSDVTVVCPALPAATHEPENIQNTIKSTASGGQAVGCNGSYLDKICTDIDMLPSFGDFNDNVASFVGKLSRSAIGHEDTIQNNTFCVNNLNDTIVIDLVQGKDLNDVFHQPADSKLSCVGLFNEPIFCSDEESFIKQAPILKDRPSFSIDIALEPYCEDPPNDHSR